MSHREQDFVAQLRERGYRVTPQREIILDALCEMGGHATIAEIYTQVHAKAPAVDKATIYRSLQLFVTNDFVHSSKVNGETVYEISEPDPHHHLVCRHCNKVMGLSNQHFDALVAHLLAEHGFLAHINHLTIPGTCADCLQKNAE